MSDLLSALSVGLLSACRTPVGLSDCRTCQTVGLLSATTALLSESTDTVGLSETGAQRTPRLDSRACVTASKSEPPLNAQRSPARATAFGGASRTSPSLGHVAIRDRTYAFALRTYETQCAVGATPAAAPSPQPQPPPVTADANSGLAPTAAAAAVLALALARALPGGDGTGVLRGVYDCVDLASMGAVRAVSAAVDGAPPPERGSDPRARRWTERKGCARGKPPEGTGRMLPIPGGSSYPPGPGVGLAEALCLRAIWRPNSPPVVTTHSRCRHKARRARWGEKEAAREIGAARAIIRRARSGGARDGAACDARGRG